MQGAGYAPSTTLPLDTRPSMFDRLAAIRFPLIALVVCYHNEGGNFVPHLQGWPAAAFAVDFVANSLGGIRVPVFFAIAGYVFFRNVQPQAAWFRDKIAARTRSVLLPLLLWSLLWMVVFTLARQVPAFLPFLDGRSALGRSLFDLSAPQLLLGFFGGMNEMFLYHLWFLRDLFVLILASPLIWGLIRFSRGWITPLLALAWLAGADAPIVHDDALFFFFVASHLAIAGRSIFWTDVAGPAAAMAWAAFRIFHAHSELSVTTHRLWVLCGVVAVLWLSGSFVRLPSLLDLLRRASRYSFFVFVAHEPLLTVVRHLYMRLLPPQTPSDWLVAYFSIVLLTLTLLVAMFRAGERCCPALVHLLNGGRTGQPRAARDSHR